MFERIPDRLAQHVLDRLDLRGRCVKQRDRFDDELTKLFAIRDLD
jgi:hypothetical protein